VAWWTTPTSPAWSIWRGGGGDVLLVNDHFGASKQVSTSSTGFDGLISAGLRFGGFAQAAALLGSGGDTLTVSATEPGTDYAFSLGGGNNLAVLGPVGASVTVYGGPGYDTYAITARSSDLTILDPAGVDTLDFHNSAAGVAVDLRLGQGQPQAIGGGGNVLALVGTFEDLVGTPYNDMLIGSGAGTVIRGRGGNDVLQGIGGSNLLDGGDGNDLLIAGTGNDILLGGPGTTP
jgi:serralysin